MFDVYVYGSNEVDQFGISTFEGGESKIPRKVPLNTDLSFNKVFKVCCGAQHTLVLTTLGKVFSFGNNDIGALGRTGDEKEPLPIQDIEYPINGLSAGDSHSIAYNTDLGVVYMWGCYRNNSGEIHDPIRLPKLIDDKHFGHKKVSKIISGANHTLALSSGNLYAWGNDEFGQTGVNPQAQRKVVATVPHKVATPKVQDVFTGLNHSFLVYCRGKGASMKRVVKGWGFNTNGQLGIGNWENQWIPKEITFFTENEINIVNSTGGDHHSLFLTDKNEVYVCGYNREGQCGVDTPVEVIPAEPREEEAKVVQAQEEPNVTHVVIEEEHRPEEIRKINSEDVAKSEENAPAQQDPVEEEEVRPKPPESIFVPVKLDFFNQTTRPVNNIYSNMDFNYALDSTTNQAYSWGFGLSYVLANKQETNEKYPFTIPKQFFFNQNVEQISLGAAFVVVSLFDPNLNLPKPQLEYDLQPYIEELRKKAQEKRVKPGKRKFELGLKEEEAEMMQAEEKIAGRSLRPRSEKKSVEAPKKIESKPKSAKASKATKAKTTAKKGRPAKTEEEQEEEQVEKKSTKKKSVSKSERKPSKARPKSSKKQSKKEESEEEEEEESDEEVEEREKNKKYVAPAEKKTKSKAKESKQAKKAKEEHEEEESSPPFRRSKSKSKEKSVLISKSKSKSKVTKSTSTTAATGASKTKPKSTTEAKKSTSKTKK